jgi:Ca2+-transporting ATPase
MPQTSNTLKPTPDINAINWHTLSPEETLQQLESDRDRGLNPDQVKQRLQTYGLNELQAAAGRPTWQILLDQFTNIMLIMLIAVAVVAGILDFSQAQFPKDAIAIFAIVILNGLLGYLQESRAEEALAALKQMAPVRVRVLRDGQEQELEADHLVPGDIVFLEAGGQIAADGRLLAASNLQIRESALTGESIAVTKDADRTLEAKADLGDRQNLVFRGTEVLQGRGLTIVTRTGMQTELGRIATLLEAVESEPTPLQTRMTQLGNVLVSGSLILVGIVVLGGLLRTGDLSLFDDLLEVSLSMAVAVVPEGLPAVITVTLAIGTQRMVRRRALIRKLPAVETLGSVTTICSDKTGTLTQNKMVVQKICTPDDQIQITGEGYQPEGDFARVSEGGSSQAIDPNQHPNLKLILLTSVLCNDATLQFQSPEPGQNKQEKGQWQILGDPTEGALLTLAGKGQWFKGDVQSRWQRLLELPFSAERKRMTVLIQNEPQTDLAELLPEFSPYLLLSKGSPEIILECCNRVAQVNGDRLVEVPLTPDLQAQILQQNETLALQGLRVLGLAYNTLAASPEQLTDSQETDLCWLGLVGMLDAARPEARIAVQKSLTAGIRPIMITGDHPLTAQAIAVDLGISSPGAPVVRGQTLEQMSDLDLDEQVMKANVYARVSPEHKLRIVQSLQRRREIVAMTGDGVNDAPALKQADIGIAMGITGTDVSKEASDMVLLDDNFATIVAATEEGRVVYDNIRRFVKYILGSNIGEVLTIAASPLMGLGGVPLSPLQILWMNLVTDGLPALALAMEPPEPDVMERSPYSPHESIFARGLGWYMVRIGLIFAILAIVLMMWAYNYVNAPGYTGHPDEWKSMVFTTLCLAQMGHALAVRSDSQFTFQLNPFSNPYLVGAVGLTTGLQLLLLYVPPLQKFFDVHPLTGTELLICFGFSALMFAWIELEKLVILLYKRNKK